MVYQQNQPNEPSKSNGNPLRRCSYQILGRWQSAAYKTYIRKSEQELADLITTMVKRPICKPNAVFLFQNVAVKDRLITTK